MDSLSSRRIVYHFGEHLMVEIVNKYLFLHLGGTNTLLRNKVHNNVPTLHYSLSMNVVTLMKYQMGKPYFQLYLAMLCTYFLISYCSEQQMSLTHSLCIQRPLL